MNLENLIKAALEEDIGSGDLTTQLTVDPDRTGIARVVSRYDGILSGIEPFVEVFRQIDESLRVFMRFEDGEAFSESKTVCELKGSIASILSGERTALNFLGRLSGIATLTRRYVDAVRGTKTVILDTRKTTPLLRSLEKTAVRCGGGENHRTGLYDMILVKDNHEIAAGGISAALSKIMGEKPTNMSVEVEVQRLDQIEEALKYKIDRLMLDNFDVEMIRNAVDMVSGRVPLEVSGGVNLDNVREFAAAGVDFISIGALTHSALNLDFSLQLSNE